MALLDDYNKSSKFEDFKDLYTEFLDSSRKPDKDKVDLNRCIRLQTKVDEAFAKYSKKDKIEVIRYLHECSLVPSEWVELQSLIDGEFSNITHDSDFKMKEYWKH